LGESKITNDGVHAPLVAAFSLQPIKGLDIMSSGHFEVTVRRDMIGLASVKYF
jgi:hypothetical protein